MGSFSWLHQARKPLAHTILLRVMLGNSLHPTVCHRFSLTALPSYEVTSTKYTRDIYKELLISLVASLFMGYGVLFLLLWVGIYV